MASNLPGQMYGDGSKVHRASRFKKITSWRNQRVLVEDYLDTAREKMSFEKDVILSILKRLRNEEDLTLETVAAKTKMKKA